MRHHMSLFDLFTDLRFEAARTAVARREIAGLRCAADAGQSPATVLADYRAEHADALDGSAIAAAASRFHAASWARRLLVAGLCLLLAAEAGAAPPKKRKAAPKPSSVAAESPWEIHGRCSCSRFHAPDVAAQAPCSTGWGRDPHRRE